MTQPVFIDPDMNNPSQTNLLINRQTIIDNIITLFSGSAIAQGLGAVTFILTARQLGPEQYGQYTSSITLATFCSIVFSLGLNIWLLREGGKSPNEISKLVGSVITIIAGIGTIWLIGMYILAGLIKSSSLPEDLVRIASVIIWLDSLLLILLTGFKSILRNRINSIIQAAIAALILLLTLLLIWTGEQQASIFMIARACILAISLIVTFIITWRLIKLSSDRKIIKTALKESPPYAVSEFLAWTYMRVDVLIIAFFLDGYSVGLYAPAEGIINTIYIVPLAVHFVMVPVLSNLFVKDIKQAWITTRRFNYVLLVVGLGLFLLVFFGAEYIVLLLGPSYADSLEILKILSIILFFHSLSFGAAAVLVATKQQTQRTIVQTIAVFLNIALNIYVIDLWGITGVALVYVFTEIILFVGYFTLVFRYRRKSLSGLSIMGPS